VSYTLEKRYTLCNRSVTYLKRCIRYRPRCVQRLAHDAPDHLEVRQQRLRGLPISCFVFTINEHWQSDRRAETYAGRVKARFAAVRAAHLEVGQQRHVDLNPDRINPVYPN